MENEVLLDSPSSHEKKHATDAGADLSIALGELSLANPIMPASGCFGPELAPFLAFDQLGAVVTKTVFSVHRAGNPAHRLTETEFGMLNSVGIPSLGDEGFRNGLLKEYQASGTRVVVSIGGLFTQEYFTVAEKLGQEDVDAFEVNVSCPNLEHDGLPIGTSPDRVFEVIQGIRKHTDHPLFVKLTPTVHSIGEIAKGAEDAGATAVTVANSFSGLAIDAPRRKSILGSGAGGYTGPAVKPLALKLVRDLAQAVTIPVIGCGGITTSRDVAEFMIAGATAIQVGTATFTRPTAMGEILAGLDALCHQLKVSKLSDLIGTLDTPIPSRRLA